VWRAVHAGPQSGGRQRHVLPAEWTGLVEVPVSGVDGVGTSPACWMQGLFQALDEVYRGMKREGSRGIVLVRYGRQDS
jgi:hypothetical protein